MRSRRSYKDRSRKFSVRMRILYHRSLRGVDTGFEGVLWGDIPVRKYNKIKGRSAGLSKVLKPQSKVHLERRFRSRR